MSSVSKPLSYIMRRGLIQGRRTVRQMSAPSSQQRRKLSSTAYTSSQSRGGSFIEWYSAQLDAYPLLTKCITSGLIAAAGDILCQAAVPSEDESKDPKEKSPFTWDPWRTARFTAVGTLWVAPGMHYWYAALTTRLLPGAATPMRIAQRVAADQFAFGPLFTSGLLSMLWLLEGRWQQDFNKTLSTLTSSMPGIIMTGWSVWIPAMSINFGFVPSKYQVLFSNVLNLFWNSYLSYMSSKSNSSKEEVKNVRRFQTSSSNDVGETIKIA